MAIKLYRGCWFNAKHLRTLVVIGPMPIWNPWWSWWGMKLWFLGILSQTRIFHGQFAQANISMRVSKMLAPMTSRAPIFKHPCSIWFYTLAHTCNIYTIYIKYIICLMHAYIIMKHIWATSWSPASVKFRPWALMEALAKTSTERHWGTSLRLVPLVHCIFYLIVSPWF